MPTGSKHFRKRDAILDFLRCSDQHPSAETVYAALKPRIPDLSLATVYRNIALFKNQGQITSLGSVGGVERYDGNIAPHVHFVCGSCGRILDLHEMQVPQSLNDTAARASGAVIDQCQLTFYGHCKTCG